MSESFNPRGSRAPLPLDLEATIRLRLPNARPESIRSLVASASFPRIGVNHLVWAQGEPIRVTLLVEGFAAFRRVTLDGQQLITAIARPGDLYGTISISGSLAAADFVAMTDCRLATWPGTTFRDLVARDPGLALDVIDRLASLLTVITERLDGFLHQDARRRVLRVLARYRDLLFADPPILSRTQLPGLVGTSREMTGRVLRSLEMEGAIVRVGRSGLRLLDASVLEGAEDRGERTRA